MEKIKDLVYKVAIVAVVALLFLMWGGDLDVNWVQCLYPIALAFMVEVFANVATQAFEKYPKYFVEGFDRSKLDYKSKSVKLYRFKGRITWISADGEFLNATDGVNTGKFGVENGRIIYGYRLKR